MPSRRLSKSRFTAGLQCLKQLWWRVHEPNAPELVPDASLRATFERGRHVGEVARGYVPGGVLVDLPHYQVQARVQRTAALLAAGPPAVYEASFVADGVFVAVDILERAARGHTLIEVKSTTGVKDEHIPDAAIQAHVVRAAGLDVPRVEVMHLNRACRFPDLSDLFTRADVTERVAAYLPSVPERIAEQAGALDGPLPDVAVGDHCEHPYPCPFLERCWPTRPAHHVSTLYRVGRRAAELEAEGYATVDQLPDGLGIGAVAERQRRAVREGRVVVEPELASALDAFARPLGFLDFETVAPAIPVWPGCHPYDVVPVQFSAFLARDDGRLDRAEWLADGPGDPRPALARPLLAALEDARAIVAYNASFERQCIRGLAEAAPELADRLLALERKLIDLLPVVRDHVYHPAFRGSFSLKAVLPALVPELAYGDLRIQDGEAATNQLEQLLLAEGALADTDRAPLREALLAYCERDTYAMVKLLERLKALG